MSNFKWKQFLLKTARGAGAGLGASVTATAITANGVDPGIIAIATSLCALFAAGRNLWKHWRKFSGAIN